MTKVGVIPARLAASRFPNKPMHLILGKPMLQHAFERASEYSGWDELVIATCDDEIESFCKSQNYPVMMTGSHHKRALDRVAEVSEKLGLANSAESIIVNVQADEPMMQADMFDVLFQQLQENPEIQGTVLGMHIIDEFQWRNPDTVKIVANDSGEILYTSRAAIPYSSGNFSPEIGALRIFGLFAFRAPALAEFTRHPETRLESLEACDSNRVLSMNFRQYVARYPYRPAFSVDSPDDIGRVEAALLSVATQ